MVPTEFDATVGLGFGGGVSLGTTYRAYVSPNKMFSTVKEVALKLAVDDTVHFRKRAVRPYALVAFELDTAPGRGQLDAGAKAGRYLELGIAPGWAANRVSVAVPVKVGLSLSKTTLLTTAIFWVSRGMSISSRISSAMTHSSPRAPAQAEPRPRATISR